MSQVTEGAALAEAKVGRSRRISAFWIIPIVAGLIAAWLAWDTLSRQGPTITISFQGAEGLQAGQSQLKYREITLGTVKELRLAPNHDHVLVKVATTRQAVPLLTEGTEFWVVKPRLFAGNLSGFETLLSGSYIGMLPGRTKKAQRDFTGRENPPVLTSDVPGHTFLLKADRLGSITLGSPVFFRDFDVGEVLGWDLGDMAKNVTIHAFVRAPFDKYVRDDSRFWNASGLDVKLGGSGVEVEVQSLRALLLGGVAFETPEGNQSSASAENHLFPLFAGKEAALAASYTRKVPFVAYFPGSVRGLAPGAEVTMHGLKIGQVTGVRLAYDPAKQALVAPVQFEVQPERFLGVGKRIYANPREGVDELVKRGLRATLQSANLLTGQMMVALDFVPNAPAATVAMQGDAFVLPTVDTGGFSGIEASASELLRKVNTVPLDQIGRNLNDMTAGLNELANGPQLKQALTSLNTLLASTQNTVRDLNAGVAPAARRLPALTASLEKLLKDTNHTLLSVDSAYGDNTRFSRELDRSLAQLNDTLRSLEALSDLLTRHPEALVRGRAGGVE
jgi:paraquat-inducible protein B